MEALTVVVRGRAFSDTDGRSHTVEEALWDKRMRSTFEECNNGNQRRLLPRLTASIHKVPLTPLLQPDPAFYHFIFNLYKTFPI